MLGRTAASAMVEHGILIDITHMSERVGGTTSSLCSTTRDPETRVPVIATHMACRFGGLEYAFSDETIRRVAERGGVMGCILCKHYITSGLRTNVDDLNSSIDALCRHVDHIRECIRLARPRRHRVRPRWLHQAGTARARAHGADADVAGRLARALRSPRRREDRQRQRPPGPALSLAVDPPARSPARRRLVRDRLGHPRGDGVRNDRVPANC